MFLTRSLAAACVVALGGLTLSLPADAQNMTVRNGDDTFVSVTSGAETLDTPGDTFLAGQSAVARGAADGDLHVAGFDVSVSADTGEDLYAAGATVVARGKVAQDLFAAGFTVRTEGESETDGNARLFGANVTVEGPVGGALTVAGRDVLLDAEIGGDVRILAQTLSFGPRAVVAGTLTYSTENEIAVPERVAPAERVRFEPLSRTKAWKDLAEMRKDWPVLPTFVSLLSAFVVSLLFFLVVGALALGFVPNQVEKLRQAIVGAPGRMLLLGVIGLSILFGMVPITGMTIVGIPFVPIVVLAIIVAWTLGYALGVYAGAMRFWSSFGGDPEPGKLPRLVIFAAAITVVALLNFIPFVGWVINYTIVLLGVGAMTDAIFRYMIGNRGPALDVDMNPTEPGN